MSPLARFPQGGLERLPAHCAAVEDPCAGAPRELPDRRQAAFIGPANDRLAVDTEDLGGLVGSDHELGSLWHAPNFRAVPKYLSSDSQKEVLRKLVQAWESWRMSESAGEYEPEFDLGDRMRKALRHAGLETQEMADYLGVSRNSVSNWINGRNRPNRPALRLWAMRCGVSHAWLTTGAVSAGGSRNQHLDRHAWELAA